MARREEAASFHARDLRGGIKCAGRGLPRAAQREAMGATQDAKGARGPQPLEGGRCAPYVALREKYVGGQMAALEEGVGGTS